MGTRQQPCEQPAAARPPARPQPTQRPAVSRQCGAPVRGAPPALKKRRPWTDEEMDQLDRLYRGAGTDVDYQKLAEDLGTGRTSDMVRLRGCACCGARVGHA